MLLRMTLMGCSIPSPRSSGGRKKRCTANRKTVSHLGLFLDSSRSSPRCHFVIKTTRRCSTAAVLCMWKHQRTQTFVPAVNCRPGERGAPRGQMKVVKHRADRVAGDRGDRLTATDRRRGGGGGLKHNRTQLFCTLVFSCRASDPRNRAGLS